MEKVYENNNILYKILSCLLIAMYAVMCLYGSTVCATDDSFDYSMRYEDKVVYFDSISWSKDISEIIGDLHLFIFTTPYRSSGASAKYSVDFYVSNTPDVYFNFENNKLEISTTGGTCVRGSFGLGGKDTDSATLEYQFGKGLEDKVKELMESSDTSYSKSINYSFLLDKSEFLFAGDMNVIDKSTNDVLFSGASQEALAGVTIPAIQSAEEIPQAIVKTMKVVIPVGLVVLGIGLVIYLIKSLILRMQSAK